MIMKKLVKRGNDFTVNEGLIQRSIVNYIEKSNFPKKLVLSKLKIKHKGVIDSINKAERIISKVNQGLISINDEIDLLDSGNIRQTEDLKLQL